MNTIESKYQKSGNACEFFEGYADYMSVVLKKVDYSTVMQAVDCFLKARENDGTIYFAGNGGSASTASHFSQDFSEISRKAKVDKGFRALSLTDNNAAMTALGNDYSFDDIFALQMQYHFNSEDVLVVISASGNSTNVIKAVELAKKRGGKTIGIVAFDGGKLAKLCDYVIHVPTDKGEYGPAEDAHLIINHMIVTYLMLALKQNG